MRTHTLFAVITVATMFHASVGAQQIPSAASNLNTKDLTQSAESRTMVERGLKGSKDRPEPQAFSGQPLFPAVPFGQAAQGTPYDKANATTQGSTTASMVTKSARFAIFETAAVKSASAGSMKAAAAAAPAPKSSPENAKASGDPRAQMITPVDGSVLYPSQDFVWTAGNGVSDYFLSIGSCSGCGDLLYEDEGRNLSRAVPLPVDGRLIFVTLFSAIDGSWYWIEYEYQASKGGNPVPAQMTSPASGSTLVSQQTFAWNAGYGVGAFYLRIGSCQGCDDLLNENEEQNLSRRIDLPVDGRTIFARLFSLIGSTWYYFDYEYRASLIQNTQLVRVNIVNQLALPVNIAVNGQVVGSCPALTTAGINVEVSQLTVSFQVIQPALNGRSLGDEMSGVFSKMTNPSGTINFVVSNQIGSNYYFEPLITNQTPVPLEIEVNGGLQVQNRCNCAAPAGDTNVATGYYLFYSNSNVRLYFNASNYTGPYLYFGIDNGSGVPLSNYLTGTAAQVRLVATREP